MQKIGLSAVVILGLAAIGCGGSDPIDRMVSQQQEQIDLLCGCPQVVGASDAAACRMTLEMYTLSATQITCLRNAYSTHAADLNPALDCQHNAGVTLNNCIRTALAMCPPAESDAISQCNSQFATAVEACPSVPTSAADAFNACFSSGG